MRSPAELCTRFIALSGVRNSLRENFHAGRGPSSRTGDFSDVKVVTPDEEIPWNRWSRLSDPEMRALMLDVEKGMGRSLAKLLQMDREERLDEFLIQLDEELFGGGRQLGHS
jgi:hypothetical protein